MNLRKKILNVFHIPMKTSCLIMVEPLVLISACVSIRLNKTLRRQLSPRLVKFVVFNPIKLAKRVSNNAEKHVTLIRRSYSFPNSPPFPSTRFSAQAGTPSAGSPINPASKLFHICNNFFRTRGKTSRVTKQGKWNLF